MIIAGTGHRPNKILVDQDALIQFACHQLRLRAPSHVISGMAQGWDAALAAAARHLCIPFTAAVPFAGYGKKYWPQTIFAFMDLCAAAQHVEIVCDYPGTRALQLRNEWMVDRADRVLALHDGSWGCTFNCIQYARKRGVRVENCWDALMDPEILV